MTIFIFRFFSGCSVVILGLAFSKKAKTDLTKVIILKNTRCHNKIPRCCGDLTRICQVLV
jgi:hypothetical protein